MRDGAKKVFSNLPGLRPSCPCSPRQQKYGGFAEREPKEGDFELRELRRGYIEVGVRSGGHCCCQPELSESPVPELGLSQLLGSCVTVREPHNLSGPQGR